ncbi:MAG: DUF1761 domain-containing protein [Taibaiella sp.]|nr:DUF1761 domain-containing protein [Taibaiella sp.]
MKEQKINHLAIWLLVIVFQVISTVWYSPYLFADRWMNYLGKTITDFNGESLTGILWSLAGAIAYCYLLAYLFKNLGINNGRRGMVVGLFLSIVCFALQTLTQDSFQMRPPGLSLINTGIVIINFSLAGLVLGSWKKFKTK